VRVCEFFTVNLLVELSQSDGLEKTLLVELKSARKVDIIEQLHVQLVTNHLRTKHVQIKIEVVSHQVLRVRSDELDKVQKNLCERTSLSPTDDFTPLLSYGMDLVYGPRRRESADPRKGPLLWLNHRTASAARLSLPPVGSDAQSIVGATSPQSACASAKAAKAAHIF
jgi:hypothetical protein